MPSTSVYINQIALDNEYYVWASGQDLRRFNGSSWEYYNSVNTAMPSASPYYLDTRTLSIDPEDNVWVGAAQWPVSGGNDIAVFWLNTNNLSEGGYWSFSDIGSFTEYQEVSNIYACPFGDDVLAFITPLNGVGGTAGITGYTRIKGATGGRLFYYLKETDKWDETIPGYTWPHIYDIETKGVGGVDYRYYMGTAEGLFVVPQGQLEALQLSDGSQYIKQAIVYNTSTSGIISDSVYCLDFDEDGNLWIGTDLGLSYFDGTNFWNYPTNGPITSIKSRPNGHVFYSMGDGELGAGTGLWHFNGITHTQYTQSNSSLSGDNILGIELVESNTSQGPLIVRENSLWVLEYNFLGRFDYDIPHVYASSKYEGATGWNFSYYSATGDSAPLPKVNKYTWTYPDWQIYDSEYLAVKHPGLDPRNLFLTTKLQDIADGRAGKQPYWNNFPLPTYEQEVIAETIQPPKWTNPIDYISGASGNIGMVNITSSTTQTLYGETKYYVSGNIAPDLSTGKYSVNFGYYSDQTPAILTSSAPSINEGATGSDNTTSKGKTSFIVAYSESGYVDTILPFSGTSVDVQSLCSSTDGLYIYASGTFDKFIEVGEFLFGAYPNLTGPTGPTGAPVGITNTNIIGASGYPGIGATANATPTINSAQWLTSPGSGSSVPTGYLDFGFDGYTAGATGTRESLNMIYINFTSITSTNYQSELENALTGQTIRTFTTGGGIKTNFYKITGVYSSGSSTAFSVTYVSGPTGQMAYYSENVQISLFPYYSTVYPYTLYNTQDQSDSQAIFVAKIGRDLGSRSSFTDIPTEGYSESVRKSYRINEFRYFPPLGTYPGGTAYTSVDVSKYYLNLSVSHSAPSPVIFSTLKNAWDRTNDMVTSPESFGDPSSSDFGSYIKMDADDLMLIDVRNTSNAGSGFYINSIKSLSSENGVLITGQSTTDFSMSGLNLVHPSPSPYSSYPFYLLIGPTGSGITGGIINIGGTSSNLWYNKILSDKDDSTYYVTTIFGDYGQGLTGSYFGNQIVLGSSDENYLYTARITQQGVTKGLFSVKTGVSDRDMQLLKSDKLNNNQFFFSYQNTPGATGYNTALIKSNSSGKILDFETLGDFTGDCVFSSDEYSNVFGFGINTSGVTGYTGGTGSIVYYGSTGGFSTLFEQYYPDLGINLGNIISRPGSGAWTWCDVHESDSYLEVPLMSTVILNNYSSSIYGKNNNTWILTDSSTGRELLNVKETPYFIYTFTESGYYTIYNRVEDSEGNVYEISKPGFINVINHKEKRADDPRPNFVDSADYGSPVPPFNSRDYQAMKLSKDLAIQEKEIMANNRVPFGSAIVIPNNPDATFNQ